MHGYKDLKQKHSLVVQFILQGDGSKNLNRVKLVVVFLCMSKSGKHIFVTACDTIF